MFTSELFDDIPPPENARKTQIAGTLPTYKKAADMLAKTGVKGKALDFGAGLGHGTGELGPDADSYEPYPGEKFKPHFIDVTQIPDNSYHKIVNLNVLNVVPNAGEQRIRDSIVKNIGRVLAPGGVAIITTRGKDVLTIKGTPGEEPMSMISKIGTYQKGFTSGELRDYITSVLGDGFEVSNVKLGPAGVMIRKLAEGLTEFAPPGGDDGGDDGFSEETLKRLAAQWWNGDEDPRVEKILAAAGWEIGQDEGGYDNGGAFVVQAGDVNGNSYMSWPAEELEQGVAEGRVDSSVSKAIAQRILDKHHGFLNKYGASSVMHAIDVVADWNKGTRQFSPEQVDEWVQQVIRYVRTGAGEGLGEDSHTEEENGMAKDNLNKMSKASQQINNKVKKLGGNKSLEPWQQQLVATAADKVDAVHHSMDDEVEEGIDGRGERHEPELNPGDSIMLTTVKGRTYTGTLSHINDDSIVFKTLGQGGNPHAPDDMESRSHIVAIKMSHVANVEPLSMTENEQDWGEYEDGDEEEQQDEGFFVAIGSEDDGAFVGMITKDGGKWRETEITGNAPYGWGGSYMSYLSSEDVMQHLRNDYGRHAQVKGPFSTEEAAMQYAQSHFDLGSDEEFGDEDYDTLEEQRLQVGDPIVVTYGSEYEGQHGEIIDFSPSGSFVIVRMQNGDEASMHLSDVEYSEHEDEEDDDGIMYEPPKRRMRQDDELEEVVDPGFERTMGKMTSPDALNTREAVALMIDLMHNAGASYKEALQQASTSYEMDPAKLQALYQQQIQTSGEQLDELSPATLKSYSGKAQGDARDRIARIKAGDPDKRELVSKAEKRVSGIKQAHSKYKTAKGLGEENTQHDKQVLEYTIKNMKRDGYEFFAEDDNGFDKCWTGYKKVGLKKKGGKMVNDCRPVKKK